MALISIMPLVPDRECGSCNVCCVDLAIDEPDLHKPAGCRCPNLRSDGLCGIYPSRPATCGNFFCGYRRAGWIHQALRPDASGVLSVLGYADASGWRVGISFILLKPSALQAEGLRESVAAALARDMPVDLVVSGPEGLRVVNELLADLLAGKDIAGALNW